MRARFVCVVSVFTLGTLVGCSDADTTGTGNVDTDTGIADTGTAKDSTVKDTAIEDTAIDDTGTPADTADTATGDTGGDTLDTAVVDTAVVDAADTAVVDTAVVDATDAADAADAADTTVADATDAVADADADASVVALPSAEVWVTRVGDGTGTLSNASAPVFIDKFQLSTLALLGTINVPTAASGSNQPLTMSGNATSEGVLNRSNDGKYVTLAGYATAPGTASVASSATTSDAGSVVLRVVGRVNAAGAVDTSTTTTSYSGNNIRGATTMDGSQYWTAGNPSGLSYLAHGGSGAATQISTGLNNVRVAAILDDGTLWGSTQSGSTYRIFNFATTARPTTATTPVAPPGMPTSGGSPYGGVAGIATGTTTDVDTVYVCDDSGSTTGGLFRYKLVAGTWTPVTLTNVNCRGLAVTKSGTSVIIVAVSTDNPSRVMAMVDTTAGLTTGTFVTVATAATNTQFRGPAFAPIP